MRLPRVRFTVRRMMVMVAVVAVLLVTGRALLNYLGPRDGVYYGSYRYLGDDWEWHQMRANIIVVKGGMINGF